MSELAHMSKGEMLITLRRSADAASIGVGGNVLRIDKPARLKMASPYLNQPRVPLSVALPQMLDKIEAKLGTRSWRPLRRSAFAIGSN